MKITLTNDELITLLALIEMNLQCYATIDSNDFESKLYQSLFEEIRIKLYQISIIKKKKYSLKLKPSWALAFYNDFKNNDDNTSFAGNLINRFCLKIHQHFITN